MLAGRSNRNSIKAYWNLALVPGKPHVFDGEVCVQDDIGRSDFDKLQKRALTGRARTLLNAISDEMLGKHSNLFETNAQLSGKTLVRDFRP